MEENNRRAMRITISSYGAILGIAGIEHGIGEILQGNTTPNGIVIESWPNSDLYEPLSGEPAMTIIPNLLITGILAIIVSLILIIWTSAFIQKKHGGLILILLSFILLFVGGGFGPPIIGFMVGLAATRINSQFNWWNKHVSVNARSSLSKMWLYSYISSIISWFSLWPGIIILVYFTGFQNSLIVIILTLFSFGTLIFTIFSGFAHGSVNNISDNKQDKELEGALHV
ncbi:MAG TPA: hypothetical protein VMX55_01065 [candidate division Zixibacteria bacterium]|nr:hypothetical protein [candidate division Zixibacteria bacterium]